MLYRKEIRVVGGSGGDGCVSFRREKRVPFGGPDGGDGGVGGNVVIVSSSNVGDLSWLGHRREFVAERGGAGAGGRKHGGKGKDLAISVPVGTMVLRKGDSTEGAVLADLTASEQVVLVARGGRGGLGNARFATAVNQAPEIAGKGEPGEERHVILEFKLISDICLVGPPNSGKSTLLSAISRAKPEIADYPFTTREPILGVMPGDRRDFVVAEIPAIVEGAHLGKGLGNESLRHAERTRLLVYLLDGSSPTLVDDLHVLDMEINLYKGLSQKPKIVAVNKMDLPEVRARLPEVKQLIGPILSQVGAPVFYISAQGGEGVSDLMLKCMEVAERASLDEVIVRQKEITVFRPKPIK
jgi:GTPase